MLSPVLFLAALISASALCLFTLSLKRDKVVGHSTLAAIRGLLSPQGSGLPELLAQRARPNQRLVRAFGITNTFVSSSTSIHQSFVAAARALLNKANARGWEHFRDLTAQAVQIELAQHSDKIIEYSTFVQSITLRVILVGLLGADSSVEDFSREDILTASNHINQLWALSKNPATIPSHLLPQLNASLRRLLPNVKSFPNPVDIVVPAWETFWRVVAISVAYSHSDPRLQQVFTDLYTSPQGATFKGEHLTDTDTPISAKDIVNEAMRLHPPSKHIGRLAQLRFPFRFFPTSVITLFVKFVSPSAVYVKEYADVQGVLLSPDIWGQDAAQFNPWRYGVVPSADSGSQQDALGFIFGGGKTKCIGASWAPVAAGVVCSAIFDELDNSGFAIQSGSVIGGRDGWVGWCLTKIR
ncbi:hypothetical protein FA15DRAFT_689785 [Coprinopsis marcescibilis]|uniref:Cytochrome P450 n=1 Tax=Coprinopsis marcescibilis TaxID=230819 RepID=A0A5C3KFC1_COPMA|nr:hypothetical protein FA15DRAFT_689785 [Coprinopsis marcescibilis]